MAILARPMTPARVPLLALPYLLLGACADFATPADLDAPTIIAVVAEPPLVRPGASTRLAVVVAGPDGELTSLAPRWSLVESFPTVPIMGSVSTDGADAIYQAPAEVPARPEGVPPIDTVRLEVDVPTTDGTRTLAAVKAIAVLPQDAANPTIRLLDADGAEATTLTGTVADGVALEVEVTPAAGDATRYAWYATTGAIADYQSNPATLTAEAPGSGTVFVVVRDGAGGVAWRAVDVAIE